ncbi:MAG: BatD family protein [Candidatus Hydrogenedentes bacterium]|nr:BatD family protein [Candidatus Hydrogenedentota bacterium]
MQCRVCNAVLAAAVVGLLLAAAAQDSQPTVTAELSTTSFHIYQFTKLTVTIDADADAAVQTPDIKDFLTGLDVHEGGKKVEAEPLDNGGIRHVYSYWLKADEAGEHEVGAIPVTIDGKEYLTSPIQVQVREPTAEEQQSLEQFNPNAPPVDMTVPFYQRKAFWYFIVISLALLAVCAYLYRKARRTKDVYVPAQPPWEAALQALRGLQVRDLPGKGEVDAFYVYLTAILRRYIEDRFHLHAPERTTPEFLEEARGSRKLNEGQQELLRTILRYSDRVKFAQYEPSALDMDEHFQAVYTFVQETTPQITAEDEAAA